MRRKETKMIKAKKGLLIALFAALMIFAFGATSAFAADEYTANGVVWTDNFQTVTIDGTQYATTLEQGSNGMIHASFAIEGGSTYNAYFYDLTGAKLFDAAGGKVDAPRTFASYTANLAKGATLYVQTQKPAYFTGSWTSYTAAPLTHYNAIVKTETVTTAAKGDTVVIEPEITVSNPKTPDGTSNYPYLLGEDPTGTVTLTSGTAAAAAGWYVDEAKAGNEFASKNTYDGKEHTVLYYDADADSITYEKKNTRTGEWEAVSAITFKDAVGSADADRYRAQVTKTTTSGSTTTTTTAPVPAHGGQAIIVNPSVKDPTFGFMWSGATAGTAYDLTDQDVTDPTAFVELKTKGEDADAETLMAFFKDLYNIEVKENAGNAKVQQWTIQPKILEDADVTALNEKYATLLTNYGKGAITKTDPQFKLTTDTKFTSAFVEVSTANFKADHIYFTEAPNVTIKAKKIKKKAKSFTVEAVADSGNAITYKISSPSKKITMDSATGKITIAKKLKKGKYNVKVYAQTEAGNGYAAAYTYDNYAEILIKIKK
jgi:hypothetical protein